MQDIDWSEYQAFLAIARAGKLSRAGLATGTDPTTMGRKLRRLERRLNATLFERTHAGQVLTEAGEKLLVAVEAMAKAAVSAAEDGSALEGPSGTVRISVSEGFGTSVVSRHIDRFVDAYPRLRLDLVASNGFLSPSKREADIAIMLSRPKTGPILARKLSDYTLRLYANSRYLNKNRKICSISDLSKGHQLVGYIPDLLYSPELNYLSEFDPRLVPTIRSSSILAQHRIISQGTGVGVLPCFMADADSEIIPIFPEMRIMRSFWLVTHRDNQNLPRITACKEWMLKIAHEERSALLPVN